MIQEELKILKELKKMKPWYGSKSDKKEKFDFLYRSLSDLHGILVPKLRVVNNLKIKNKKLYGLCNMEFGEIFINKFSVITALHEFKHWLDFNYKVDKSISKLEWEATYYSTSRFYIVWPERIQHLKEIRNRLNTEDNNYKIAKTDINYNMCPDTVAVLDIIMGSLKC